jgi:hypothetical protein
VEADGGFFDEVEVALGVLEAAQALGGGARHERSRLTIWQNKSR